MRKKHCPVVLCILDGWGCGAAGATNAISAADTPNWDQLVKGWPYAELQASEKYVGLPEGQMGNSEVGHTNIGAGRVVPQNLPRIKAACKDGSLAQNPVLQKIKSQGGRCHIMGLLSPGGVHSHQDHILALIRTLDAAGVEVVLHAFLDGRDTPPQSAREYLKAFAGIRIGTVGGRYYGMDRDKRWDRVQKAYAAMVDGVGARADSADAAIEHSYSQDITDEFVVPTVIGDYQGMQDGDCLLMANFRADRVRQILAALLAPGFDGFERSRVVKFAQAVGMVEYSSDLNQCLETLFPPAKIANSLGEVVANAGLKQLRIAETEKYAHVTFFLNGGREETFAGEDRILVPSPKVATYDLQPEMAAAEVTDKLLAALPNYDLVVVNYANTDMVGHTGQQQAAQLAVETVDKCLGQIRDGVLAHNGTLLITADHGNAEVMVNPKTGRPHTAHTCNPVPLVLVGDAYKGCKLKDGKLADLAPTILEILDLPRPPEMTGVILLK